MASSPWTPRWLAWRRAPRACFARWGPRWRQPAATSARSTTSCWARAGCPWWRATQRSSPVGGTRCRRVWCGTSSRASSSPEEIGRAEALRTTLWHRVRTFMATRDLLILPTVAVPPFPVEMPYPTEINGKPLDNYTQWFFLTYGITVTGLPAISVPCGFTASGLPVGLQIVGRRHQETMVLRAAAAFEAAAPWAHRIPPGVTEVA